MGTIGNTSIQRLLRAAGHYSGDIDGDIGPKTRAAIRGILEANAARLPEGWEAWRLQRQQVLAAQVILKDAGFETGALDGYAGMLTKHALTEWNELQITGKRPAPWRPDDTPEDDGKTQPVPAWGKQRDVERRFGPAGGPQCTAGIVNLPYPMRIAWNPDDTIESYRCHEDVADSAERVLRRVASAYSPEAIAILGLDLFGGCFNYRKKRGGSTLSMHAYGVAKDFDPERNQLKWNRRRARLAKADAEEWWRCWEAEGWLPLGRARDFDWMHVQAPGL